MSLVLQRNVCCFFLLCVAFWRLQSMTTPWSCGACTLDNAGGLSCAACGSDRPAADVSVPPATAMWVCGACTLENHGGDVCTMCETARPCGDGAVVGWGGESGVDDASGDVADVDGAAMLAEALRLSMGGASLPIVTRVSAGSDGGAGNVEADAYAGPRDGEDDAVVDVIGAAAAVSGAVGDAVYDDDDSDGEEALLARALQLSLAGP